jgi:serine/threonine protein kinase
MNSRYEILQQLGEGGEASVWKAWDSKLQRFVAIKRLLPPSQREVPDAGDIFAEASALSALQHPNIVSVFDVESDEESGPYVVMEFLNGENLEQTIQRGGLTPEDFVSITNQILEGLVAAHKLGMQHRDIKPSNIMLTWLPDQRFIAKLLDFGLAKFSTRPKQQTVKGNNKILGSIYFMAPEQFTHRPLDYRSDLYSLGCVLYYALTTRYPFSGETPAQVMQSHLDHMVAPLRDIRPDIPAIQCDWIMWLLRRQPEHRPREAAQALELFRGIMAGEITELPQATTGLRTTTVMPTKKLMATPPKAGPTNRVLTAPSSRKPLLLGIGAGVLALGAVTFFLLKKPPQPSTPEPNATPNTVGPTKAVEPAKPILPKLTALPPVPPVTLGLAVWLDASTGLLDAEMNPVGKSGQRIHRWMDLETTLGGATDFIVPVAPSPLSKKTEEPQMTLRKNQAGFVGEHASVVFQGAQSLIATQRDGNARLLEGALDDPQFTVFLVAKLPAGAAVERIISAKCGREPKAWDIVADRAEIQGGVRLADGKSSKGKLKSDFAKEFAMLHFIRDGARNWGKLFAETSKGQKLESPPIPTKQVHGPLEILRLGALSEFSAAADADYFNGELTCVLVYNRALSESDCEAVLSHLRKRYFNR